LECGADEQNFAGNKTLNRFIFLPLYIMPHTVRELTEGVEELSDGYMPGDEYYGPN